MLSYLHRFTLPAAYDLLPLPMATIEADAMLLAIALQESEATHRRQVNGPARGFWQFEAGGGVKGVLTHPATAGLARSAMTALCYPRSPTPAAALVILEHNDVLACVFARLLLWTLPARLPGRTASALGWASYQRAWRPGKPRPADWPGNYTRAWALVEPKGDQ